MVYSSNSNERKTQAVDVVNFTNKFQTAAQKQISKIGITEILATALAILGLNHFFNNKFQNINPMKNPQNDIPNIEYKLEHKGKITHCAHQG